MNPAKRIAQSAIVMALAFLMLGAAAQVSRQEFTELKQKVDSLEARVAQLENHLQNSERVDKRAAKFCRTWKWESRQHGGIIQLKANGVAVKDGGTKRKWKINQSGFPVIKFHSGNLVATGLKSRNPVVLKVVFKPDGGGQQPGVLKLVD